MMFEETALAGAFHITSKRHTDERGSFQRIWCQREFTEQGLTAHWVQTSLSLNPRLGTLRGMHYQRSPHAEVKLVTCLQGAIYDVMVDMRPGSATYLKWAAFELRAETQTALYIPEGVAHGFISLTDDAAVHYQISAFHNPEAATGVRYNDPALNIEWPAPPRVISHRDASYPDLEP